MERKDQRLNCWWTIKDHETGFEATFTSPCHFHRLSRGWKSRLRLPQSQCIATWEEVGITSMVMPCNALVIIDINKSSVSLVGLSGLGPVKLLEFRLVRCHRYKNLREARTRIRCWLLSLPRLYSKVMMTKVIPLFMGKDALLITRTMLMLFFVDTIFGGIDRAKHPRVCQVTLKEKAEPTQGWSVRKSERIRFFPLKWQDTTDWIHLWRNPYEQQMMVMYCSISPQEIGSWSNKRQASWV